MPSGELPEVLAAQVLFWCLLPIVLFAPPRWGVLAWLVMGNLDATGPSQTAASAVGWINAGKGVAVPIYLWWRLGGGPSVILRALPARLWLALTGYATIATLWAPFPLAAVKLVGNMVGILLCLVVLEKWARRDFFDVRACVVLVVASLALGVVQTYHYGGVAYGFDGADQPSRFSSFVSAQQYGAFLVSFLAILLWVPGLRLPVRVTLCLALGAALALNGSRVWFLGAAFVLIVHFWRSIGRIVAVTAFSAASACLLAMLLVNINILDAVQLDDSSNRIVATASALLTGADTSHNVGLRDLNFRARVYEGVLDGLRESEVWQLAFGHGTSTGGSATLRAFPSSYSSEEIDHNRAVHNEWLRALYEWGAVGLSLLVGSTVTLFGGLIIYRRDPRTRMLVLPALSFLPAFLATFSTENVLAGAGNAVTLSLALVLALLWSPVHPVRRFLVADRRSH